MEAHETLTHASEGCALGSGIEIPLHFYLFGIHLAEARQQDGIPSYPHDPHARLQIPQLIALIDELNEILDRAYDVLTARLTCIKCHEVHVSPGMTERWEELAETIQDVDVEELTEAVMDRWKERMDELERVYCEETGMQRLVMEPVAVQAPKSKKTRARKAKEVQRAMKEAGT